MPSLAQTLEINRKLERAARVLNWENKAYKLKRSVATEYTQEEMRIKDWALHYEDGCP